MFLILVVVTSFITIADVLYQDLTETLKMDRKVFWQGAVQEKLGLAAAKGVVVVPSTGRDGDRDSRSHHNGGAPGGYHLLRIGVPAEL